MDDFVRSHIRENFWIVSRHLYYTQIHAKPEADWPRTPVGRTLIGHKSDTLQLEKLHFNAVDLLFTGSIY